MEVRNENHSLQVKMVRQGTGTFNPPHGVEVEGFRGMVLLGDYRLTAGSATAPELIVTASVIEEY